MPGICYVKHWTEYLKNATNMPELEPVDGSDDDEHLYTYLPKIMSAFPAYFSYIMMRTS